MAESFSASPDQAFEREKWEADVRLRERELELKADELELRKRETRMSRFWNPLSIAVAGAALAGGANAYVAYINGTAQQRVEESKAEGSRILEMIKTTDPDKAAENLRFLIATGLIEDAKRQAFIAYLNKRETGKGVSLPSVATSLPAAASASSPLTYT